MLHLGISPFSRASKQPDPGSFSEASSSSSFKKGRDGTWIFQGISGFYGIYHLVMTNIAMENPNHKWRFIAGKIIYKWAIFHGYVK